METGDRATKVDGLLAAWRMVRSSPKRIECSHVSWALLASAALVLAGCTDDSYTRPREGQRIGEFPRDPWVLRLKPALVLSIPSSHHGVWQRQKDPPRLPVDVQSLPVAETAGFVFFMPDFSGYTPDTVLRQFDEKRVNVIIRAGDMEQLRPGATGDYPPNMRERILGGDPVQTEMHGLVCYPPRNDGPKSRQVQCFGRSDRGAADVDIFVRATVAPPDANFPYPQMMAAYFTPRYDGLSVTWHTNAVNLPRWREIDQQVWRFVAAWTVPRARQSRADPAPTPSRMVCLPRAAHPSVQRRKAKVERVSAPGPKAVIAARALKSDPAFCGGS